MRCFVAVDVEEGLKDSIINLQKQLAGFDAKLVEKENLHFTLKFLGEVDPKRLEEAKDRIKRIAGGFGPFEIDVHGVGAFPSLNYVHVVWIGAGKLFDLQKAVDGCLADMFGREKEITPHLTIARIRSARNKAGLKAFVEKHKEMEMGRMTVKDLRLKKSTLTRSGPVYEDIEVFRLANP